MFVPTVTAQSESWSHGQQVAGEREQQRERQQDDADHPVELARRLVGAVVEDAAMCRKTESTMRCAAHRCMLRTSEPNVTAVSRFCTFASTPSVDGRPVEEHQEDAGDRQQDEQEERQAAEAQRVGDLHRVPLHLHRVKVVQHVVHDHVGAVPGAVGVALAVDRAGPEDRVPRLRRPRILSPTLSTTARPRSCGRCPFPLLPLPLATSALSLPSRVSGCSPDRGARSGRRRRSRVGWCGRWGRRRPTGR